MFVQVHWYMLVVIAQCSTQQAGWSVCPWGWIGSAFSLPPSSPCGSVSFLSVQLKLWSSLASSWTIVVNIVFICFPFGNQNRIKSDLKLLMSSNEHSLLLASKYSECVVCIRVKPQQRDFAFPHLPISRLDPTHPSLYVFWTASSQKTICQVLLSWRVVASIQCVIVAGYSAHISRLSVTNWVSELFTVSDISFFDFHSAQPFHSWHFHTSRLLHWIGKCSKSTQNHSR